MIANCLGIESAKILRRDKKNNCKSVSNLEFKTEIENSTKRGINEDRSHEDNKHLKDKNNTRRKFEGNIGSKSASKNSNNNRENINNCFIIFNKSNIKNLKKEINRYDSKNVTIETEPLNSYVMDERKKYLINPITENKQTQGNVKTYKNKNSNNYSIEDSSSDRFSKANNNDFSCVENSSKSRFLLSSPQRNEKIDELEDRKPNKCIVNLAESKTNLEKGIYEINFILDDILIREWLDSLGCKNTFLIDLTKEELTEFKDG